MMLKRCEKSTAVRLVQGALNPSLVDPRRLKTAHVPYPMHHIVNEVWIYVEGVVWI